MKKQEDSVQQDLLHCAYIFSPRVEATCPGTIILDLTGTERLLGDCNTIAGHIRSYVLERGFDCNVSIAANPDAAHYAAKGFAGITIIPPGEEAHWLGELPINALELDPDVLEILDAWGIHDLESLAALPSIPLTERLGQYGFHLQELARGAATRELILSAPPASFEECEELEEAIELLEPLAFVLNRMLENVMQRLAEKSLATDHIQVDLSLEIHSDLDVRDVIVTHGVMTFQRTTKLPIPTQDVKVLLKLVQLDLAAHPPHAPVKKIRIEAIPARVRLTQMGLFQPLAPEPAKLEITLARLRAVVGEHDDKGRGRVGFPATVDIHRPDSFQVLPFNQKWKEIPAAASTCLALRTFRPPVLARVESGAEDAPVWISFQGRRGRVVKAVGPWRGGSEWWDSPCTWLRDEWDIHLNFDGEAALYRIYRDLSTRQWFVQGMYD